MNWFKSLTRIAMAAVIGVAASATVVQAGALGYPEKEELTLAGC